MKAHGLVFCVVLACGGSTETSQPATLPTASATATATATTAPQASPALDLSTEDKARAAILDALKRDDKETFKKCVTQRILSSRKDFDAWYAVWKSAADKNPDAFKKVTVSKEGADYKLDEN